MKKSATKTVKVQHGTAKAVLPHAKFNYEGVRHHAVDVKDGGETFSFRTSEGKRLTVSFVPYRKDGAPQCVDVQFHDSGEAMDNAGVMCPTMQAIGFTVGSDIFDTRNIASPCTLLTVLLDDASYPARLQAAGKSVEPASEVSDGDLR